MDRILVVIRTDSGSFSPEQLLQIKRIMDSFAPAKANLLFADEARSLLGFTFKTPKDKAQIRSALEAVCATKDKGHIFVLGLENDFSCIGNSSGWRHL